MGAGGGTPELVFEDPAGPVGPLQLLPGGQLLYTLNSGGRWDEDGQIVVRALESGDSRVVLKGGTDARYVRPGYLVYAVRSTLVVIPFELPTLSARGGPMALVDGIAIGNSGNAQFSVSETGSLVYIPRTSLAPVASKSLAWVDRLGRESPIGVEPRNYIYARVSPDGRRAAVDDRQDVWVLDFDRETLTRLTSGAEQDFYGTWTPDGRDLVFASGPSGPEGPHNLYRQSANGKGGAERLTNSRVNQIPLAVTPDGHTVIFRSGTVEQFDIHALSLSAPRTDTALLSTRFSERNAAVSPDGRWIAYESDQSGRIEVYVRPFPKVDDGLSQVSSRGGSYPVWSRKSSELFYASPDGSIMAATVRTEPNFSVAPATRLFAGAYSMNEPGRTFDVGPDGRFLMIKQGASPVLNDARMVLVQNWIEELKSRVPLNVAP